MAVNRERKMVPSIATDLYVSYQTLDQVRTEINRLIDTYGGDAVVQKYNDHGEEYLGVIIQVPETDKRMADRIAQEERREAEQAVRDLADFERLKAKFGGAA